MTRWKKRFEKWKTARSPVSRDEVEPILERLFGDRLIRTTGTSHQYLVSTPELQHLPGFEAGHVTIVVEGGQRVKSFYLERAYQAAVLLGLYPVEEVENDNEPDIADGERDESSAGANDDARGLEQP